MYGGLQPRPEIDWLYLIRSEGGKGLVSIVDYVNDERKNLELYAL